MLTIPNADKDVEKQQLFSQSFLVGLQLWKSLVLPYKTKYTLTIQSINLVFHYLSTRVETITQNSAHR